jgi:DNA (cytosine-5)-methyltransferase 1
VKARAYYNEIDPHAAAWLRELVKQGLIAFGDVDERDIREVRPDDLRPYTQAHFFAGIGVWSYALRLARWADDLPVWTGSCPCQPFSDAGAGAGFADPRHLWPDWFALLKECRPPVVFGEQVSSPAGLAWFDVVSADLEDAGYAVGAADIGAASVGAPHIRQRLFFVADADFNRTERAGAEKLLTVSGCAASLVADAERDGCGSGGPGAAGAAPSRVQGADGERERLRADARSGGTAFLGGVGDSERFGWQRREGATEGCLDDGPASKQRQGHDGPVSTGEAGSLRGFWSDAEWLPCRDGKARPVEPGSFPLAHGAPVRVGRLRGYGNCIVPQVAAEFIAAYREVA